MLIIEDKEKGVDVQFLKHRGVFKQRERLVREARMCRIRVPRRVHLGPLRV